MSNIIKKGMKSFHSSQLVSVCTYVIIELGVNPQKLTCTPQFEKQGVHVPPVSKWSGHAGRVWREINTQNPNKYWLIQNRSYRISVCLMIYENKFIQIRF